MSNPFKVKPTEAPATKGVRVKEPGFSKIMQHAIDEGETVSEASQELRVPDHTVGNPMPYDISANRGEHSHPERPVYEEANPYPVVERNMKKPFKLQLTTIDCEAKRKNR